MKRDWLQLIKPGDYLVLLFGLALVLLLSQWLWQQGRAEQVIIRSHGKIHSQWPLSRDREIRVAGPLGDSVVEIKRGRVRIASDPSPRQYCVRQGWLELPGAVALCLPNQLSIELTGGRKPFDSLSY